jgi:2'-5' RNA ligase
MSTSPVSFSEEDIQPQSVTFGEDDITPAKTAAPAFDKQLSRAANPTSTEQANRELAKQGLSVQPPRTQLPQPKEVSLGEPVSWEMAARSSPQASTGLTVAGRNAPPPLGTVPVLDAPVVGGKQIYGGLKKLGEASDTEAVHQAREEQRKREGRPITPAFEADPKATREAGFADVMQGANVALTPAFVGAGVANPVGMAKGLGEATLASKAAGKVAEGLDASEDQKRLAEESAFFAPMAMRMGAGFKSAPIPENELGISGRTAEAFGGAVKGAYVKTPQGSGAGVKVGSTAFAVGKVNDVAAAMSKARLVEGAASDAVHGVPAPAPPPPPGPAQVTSKHVDTIAQAIQSMPEEQRSEAMLEAHENLSKWILDRGKVLGPDGKLATAKNPEQAESIAQKWINDAVTQADKAAAEQAKVAAKSHESDIESARRGASGEAPTETAVNQVPVAQRASTLIPAEANAQMGNRVDARNVAPLYPQQPDIVPPGGQDNPKAITATPPKTPPTAEELAQIGAQESESGRQVLQPKETVAANQKLAIQAAPELHDRLAEIAGTIPGAQFERLRPQKSTDRAGEKVEEENKPPETVPDYLAAQVAADTPQAKDQLVAELKRNFNVLEVEDKFLDGRPDKAGYPSTNVQIQMGNGLTSEVQIVPREVQDVSLDTHKLYSKGRDAEVRGDNAERDRWWGEAEKINQAKLGEFKARNGIAAKASLSGIYGSRPASSSPQTPPASSPQSSEPAGSSQTPVQFSESDVVESASASGTQHPSPAGTSPQAGLQQSGAHTGQAEPLQSGQPQESQPSPPASSSSRANLTKGQRVLLKNGSEGEVGYAHPEMNIVRVTPANGKGKIYAKREELTPIHEFAEQDISDTSHFPTTNEGAREVEHKYEHGSTQTDIPDNSEASRALDLARKQIADSDLAGKGKDVGGNHVTVRYGLDGDQEKVKAYLSQQRPFEAKLGKTAKFPPSEHSDGAAVIIAPIESPELHRLNAEIEKHGQFAESSFPEYKPHATVAYVKPSAANRYVGLNATEGKTFTVDSIAITDRDGKQDVVKLRSSVAARGTEATAAAAKKSGAESTPEQASADIQAQSEQMRMHLDEIAEHDPALAKAIEAQHPEVKELLAKARTQASNKESRHDVERGNEGAVRETTRGSEAEVRAVDKGGETRPAVPEGPAEGQFHVGQSSQRIPLLIQEFSKALREGSMPTDPRDIRAMAKNAVGGDPSQYIDDIYDAIEGATNNYMRGARPEGLAERIRFAESIEKQIGRRTRTLEITARQQFSTPHTVSEAVAYAADAGKGDTVLEPTAGTGNLVEPIDNAKTILTNEIEPRRADVLRANGYDHVTQDDYLEKPFKADVIVTNPPWGKISSGRYRALDVPAPWGKFNDVSERFMVKNMRELTEGGRLVAVAPTTIMQPGSAGFRKWLEQNGTIRAIIQSPPGAYEHRGTSVDSLLLVVDKGKVPDAQPPILRVESNQPKDWAEYAAAIRPLADGGSHARSSRQNETPAALGDRSAARPESADSRNGSGRGLPGVRESGASPEPVRPEPARVGSNVVSARNLREPLDGPGADGAAQPAAAPRLVRQSARALRPVGVAPARLAEFEEASSSPVFTPYVLRSGISGNPHPRQIVETRSLAGAPAPEIRYKPSKGVITAHDRKSISDEQVDTVAAVGQANDAGHAMLVADDVGVGKSREISAVAIDILEKGKGKRGLITSKSEVNLRDLEREMKIVAGVDPDTGDLPYKIVYLRDFKEASERSQKKTPYAAPPAYDKAIYLVESHNLTAYRRAIGDLGIDFVLADEAHTYKNEDAGIGQTWKALHREWLSRKARISYYTATPATTLDELEYLHGLKEWPLDGFSDWVARKTGHATEADQKKRGQVKGQAQDDLVDQVGSDSTEVSGASTIAQLAKGLEAAVAAGDDYRAQQIRGQISKAEKEQKNKKWGQRKGDSFHVAVSTAEMEQIMRELKMKGKYNSRDLWRGGVEFTEKEAPLSPKERDSYLKNVGYMRDVERAFHAFANENEAMKKSFGVTAFLQAAAKRRLFDMRLTRAIDSAKDSLAKGEQPVISLINVNETKEGEGYMAAALNAINVNKVLMDKETGEVTDLGEIPEAVAVKNVLLEREASEFPPSPDPIAMVQKAFGKDKVAIITGNEPPKVRRQMMEDFQKGIRKVAVISGAGKTGISLHHVLNTPEGAKGRRHLVLGDYEWSATNFKQELGRVDRAGQISPPRITALTLGSAAEKKFIATIANRMKTLGAVSKGAAESTGTGALEQFELGGDIDNMVVRSMWRSMPNSLREWFRGRLFMDVWQDGSQHPKSTIEGASVRDFLLQLQLMPIDVGNQVWDHFWKVREDTYSGEAVANREAQKTQKFNGEILRTHELQPDLSLYEVKDAAGHRAGILAGMVTEHMPVLQQFLEKKEEKWVGEGGMQQTGIRTHREYVTFNGDKGEQISGLRLRPGQIEPIAKAFGKAVLYEHSPETALQDIVAGDKIPLDNGWELRMGKLGEKKGYIIIDGAKLSNTDRGQLVMRHGAKYNAVSGGFFYLPEDKETVQKFLDRFPIKKALAEPEKRSAQAGFARTEALNPIFFITEAAKRLNSAYDNLVERGIQRANLGRSFPDVERVDERFAELVRELKAAPQYFKAKAEAIDKEIVGGLSREQEKGFVLLADKASREWLAENKNAEYQRYYNDPAIQKALDKYKKHESELRDAQRALGGAVIEDDYLRRVYEKHVAGVGEGGKAEQSYPKFDRVITPQMANSKGRKASPEFYFDFGLHEFGPSFVSRYVATHLKLAEHNLAANFMAKATKLTGKDALPSFIDYSGDRYYSPEAARLIRESKPDSEEGKQIAMELGIDQLPKPSTVKEFGIYSAEQGGKFEGRAKSLAHSVIAGDEQAAGKAQGLLASLGTRYLGPKEVVKVLESNADDAVPSFVRDLSQVMEPITGALRQNILVTGIPHIKNILRSTMLTRPTGQLNPMSWVDAWKVAFDNELKARALKGVNDEAFDALLKHAGMSPHGGIEYKHYLNLSFDKDAWRNFFNLIPALRQAYSEPGIAGKLKGTARVGGEILSLPAHSVNAVMRTTIGTDWHKIMFGDGGLDQKARIQFYDRIHAEDPSISDAEIADRVNDFFGRYARAGWTAFQKVLAPFMLFPGWSFRSINFALRYPIRSVLPAALITALLNYVLNRHGRKKEKYDTRRLHVGGRSVSETLLKERMAEDNPLTQLPIDYATSRLRGKTRGEAIGDALSGLSGDAGALIGTANPLVTTLPEVGFNKQYPGSSEDIYKKADFHKKGAVIPKAAGGKGTEDWLKYAMRKSLPQIDNSGAISGKVDPLSFIGRNVGTSNYPEKRRKH